ncbi:hypothetical protein CY34DRAFT_806035 [Suillus luteus UH-Slu-Lm8-n1]|uniref:Uncharacterized protein n=1 Tax=Suillus luteus UH-Slu-Lm8-n1 TaxID=930992 RepID=A0A0D0B4P2_9AGAM|nr:hypothetical protein CY34DRAFT_806035 [Suillus luteus UH-Slu-Lm8-n1]
MIYQPGHSDQRVRVSRLTTPRTAPPQQGPHSASAISQAVTTSTAQGGTFTALEQD